MIKRNIVERRPSGDRGGSKSGLMTVNRLLDPKEGYKSPAQDTELKVPRMNRGLLEPKEGAQMRRRHTIDDGARAEGGLQRRPSLSSKPVTPSAGAEQEDPVTPTVKTPVRDHNDTDAVACKMALKFRLMLSEVRCIIKEFVKAPRNPEGGLKQDTFDKVLERIFEVPVINKKVSQNAYVQAGMDKELNLEKFLEWYVQNMFTQVSALTADHAMADSNSAAYGLAEKFQVSNFTIDKIKVKFDLYDLDRSGKIDFFEFQAMFCVILKVKDPIDLNPERIKRFWGQIDKNADGGIDFAEFVEWYLKNFSADTENDDDWDTAGPLEKFYNNFNPSVQRRSSLANLSKHHSME